MKKSLVTLLAACVGVTLSCGLATPALASNGAQKVPILATTESFDCETGPTSGTPIGFAVINTNGRDNAMISATVSLKRATPNETYTVRISRNSTVEHFVCFSVGGQAVTLTTNRQGNGTVHVRVPRGFPPDVPANTVTSAKVTLVPSNGPPVAIATPVVPLR